MSDYEDDETGLQNYKPTFVLIAIDTHPSMFLKRGEDSPTSPFKDSLLACYELANSLIFNKNKRSWSPFAVCLARDQDERTLVHFNDNILDSITLLKDKSQLSEETLLDLYQRKSGYDLSAVFLHCKKLFNGIKSAYYKRTIIYISNHDDPVLGDKNLRFAALNEAKQFQASDIDFQLVTMTEHFDYTHFYNELFSVIDVKPVENYAEDMGGLLEKLSSAVLSRFYQRKLAFYPFLGDDQRFFKILQKNFIQKPKLYATAAVTSSGKPVVRMTKNVGVQSFTLNSDRSIRFDLQERFDLKNTDFPIGYTLVYVSTRQTDVGFNFNSPAILDSDPKEDLTYFNSFWQYCVDHQKVLVCLKKTKQLDKLRFVELIPKFGNNSRVFLVKALPFYDEMKLPPVIREEQDTDVKYTPEKLAAVEGLIDRLTFDYSPELFTNPSFAKMQAFLRSELLGEKRTEEVEDLTLDREAIDKGLGEIGDQFAQLFGLEVAGEKAATKRKGAAAPRGRAKKTK